MARPATKRDDIIRVARQLFAQRGVKATTVRDIAQAAGVTEGALYRHFASKEDLARFLFAGGAELFYEFLEQAAAEAADPAQRLRLLVAGFFGFAEANAEVFGFVMSQHYEGVGAVPGTHRLPKALFVETLQAGMAEGKLRPMEPELGLPWSSACVCKASSSTSAGSSSGQRRRFAPRSARRWIAYLPCETTRERKAWLP